MSMDKSVSEQKGRRGAKVKTGCKTCRIRKVKCDESKPSCRKCVATGRKCDGYDSLFRVTLKQPTKDKNHQSTKLSPPATQSSISREDIELLGRYFSIKTIFDVDLGCNDEAEQALLASLSDASVRHAILALKALRKSLDDSARNKSSVTQQTQDYDQGTKQYCIALRSLASNLSASASGLRSTLICCQVFVSIEQVLGNYSSLTEHIIRGLKIMQEYGARPSFIPPRKLLPAKTGDLPLLDVFLIKLFAAPCKFTDDPQQAEGNNAKSQSSTPQSDQQIVSPDCRKIVPDMRAELVRIASLMLEFLDQVSKLNFVEQAHRLASEKATLLSYLESWEVRVEQVLHTTRQDGSELLSVLFMRLLHRLLTVVLLGALDGSSKIDAEIQKEYQKLQMIGDKITEGVKAYAMVAGAAFQ